MTCGEKPGTRYRNVECVKVRHGKQDVVEEQEKVREQYCESTPKPADTEVCKVLPCTSWKHGSWGRVSIYALVDKRLYFDQSFTTFYFTCTLRYSALNAVE